MAAELQSEVVPAQEQNHEIKAKEETKKRKFGFSDPVIGLDSVQRELKYNDKIFAHKYGNFVIEKSLLSTFESLTEEQKTYINKIKKI